MDMKRLSMEGVKNINPESYIVSVNYDLLGYEARTDAGVYCMAPEMKNGWSCRDVVEKNGKSQIEIQLLSLAVRCLDIAVKRIGEYGCRPATYLELLALGAQHSDLLYKYEIIAAGSNSDTWGRNVWCPHHTKSSLQCWRPPCLRSHNPGKYPFPGSIRCLELDWLDIRSTARFATIPL